MLSPRLPSRRIFSRILLGGLFYACCPLAHGQQDDKGIIVGTVTDSTGASIVNASVTILNTATNNLYTVKTNTSGFYTSPALQIGTYTVTAVKQGFETITEPNVIIDVGVRAQIDFPMHPGSVESEITVRAESPALNSTSGTLGFVIDQRTLEDLPLNGGNALALAAILPGVSSAFGATSSGFNDRGTQLSAIRVSGGAIGANANTLDGTNNQLNYLGEVAINPQSDSIAQFRLLTGAAPAQFGFTSGGIIDIASRSGGNKLFGTLYEFFRNDFLNAKNAFASSTLPKPELRYDRFGGSIGGHFIRNKLFFFANSELYRLTQTSPSYGTVPTALERSGDFSQSTVCAPDGTPVNVRIYDPVTHTGYASEKLPDSAIDPSAKAIQENFYPLPNNSAGQFIACSNVNNYLSNTKLASSQKLIVGRIDYQVNHRDGIFARYANYENRTNNAGLFPNIIASGRIDDPINQSATIGYTRVLSPNSLNDLRLSAVRADMPFNAGSYNQNWPSKLGMSNVPGTTLPSLANGVAAFNTVAGFRASTEFQITDNLTHQFATHGVAVGTDLRFSSSYNSQNSAPSGSFSFISNSTSGSPSGLGNGDQYASFLLGAVNGATATVTAGTTFANASLSVYAQDDWRAKRYFTLNFGVRYDYQQQPYEIRNRSSNFDIHRTDPVNGYFGATVYAGLGGYGRTFNQENYADISPRLGFAWSIPRLRMLVVRGGYAVYYSSTANASFAGSTNGFGATTTTYSASTNNGVALTLKNGFPSPPTQNLGAALGPAMGIGTGTMLYQESHQRTPMSQVFTLTLSKQFARKWVTDLSYLGNRGVHFVEPNYNMNQLNPTYFGLGAGTVDQLQQTVPNPYAGVIPGSFGNSTITRYYLLRPYPYYTTVLDYQPHNGNYFGNYMYLSVQRRVGSGTQVIGSYTLGKLTSDPIYVPLSTIGGLTTSGSFQNSYDRRPEHSIDPIDNHQRLTVAIITRLPFGPGQTFLRKKSFFSNALSNITFNSVLTLQGGTPLGISGANNETTATRPNYSGVKPLSNCGTVSFHTSKCWFNPAAFVNPPNYVFGNVPRTSASLRGPGTFNADASLMKNMSVEKNTLQLRLEVFNVLNHPNLGNPNTSFTATANCDVVNPALPSCGTPAPGTNANTNGNMGVITSISSPRIIQLGARLTF